MPAVFDNLKNKKMDKEAKAVIIWITVCVAFVILALVLLFVPWSIPREMEVKFALILTGMLSLIIITGLTKKKYSHEAASVLNVLQYIMIALLCAVVFTGFLFWFDYWLVGKLGRNNSYAYLGFGFLSSVACFFTSWRNPKSVWYVPFIINAVVILSALFGDFDSILIYGLVLTAATSTLGYYLGNKRIRSREEQ
jgi:hypothetical protein